MSRKCRCFFCRSHFRRDPGPHHTSWNRSQCKSSHITLLSYLVTLKSYHLTSPHHIFRLTITSRSLTITSRYVTIYHITLQYITVYHAVSHLYPAHKLKRINSNICVTYLQLSFFLCLSMSFNSSHKHTRRSLQLT